MWRSGRAIDCADDQEAIEVARQMMGGKAVEIWQGERWVAQITTGRDGFWMWIVLVAGHALEIPLC
jgi:hypothetical protein